MEKKVKLMWDFRGTGSEQTAIHHEHHLEEFIETHNLGQKETGVQTLSEDYSFSYMIIEEEHMLLVRDALRPNRAGWVEM